MTRKIEKEDLQNAIDTIKKKKEFDGSIRSDNKKIIITENGIENFSGMTLRITKGVIRNDVYYSYKAGTKWEDIDIFGKKNISFNKSDFKNN